MFYNDEVIIDDDTYLEQLPEQNPEQSYGLVPRDFGAVPLGSIEGIKKFDMPLIPRNEWSSRIKDMVDSQTRLSDMIMRGNVGNPIPHLDQNGQGYCWAYSPGSAILAARARDNQPYVRVSPHGVACKIKNFRDQGGWNPQAAEFAIKTGYPTVEFWPEKSMRREYDNSTTWANTIKLTEGWLDLVPAAYDRNLSFDQLMTCLLSRIPCPADRNWWGHSTCDIDPVEFDSSLPLSDMNRWGTRTWNSWVNWGTNSMGVIRGQKALTNGCTAVKVTT